MLLNQASGFECLVPLVEIKAFLQVPVFVLDHVTFMKTERRVVGITVHFTNIHAPVTGLRELFDPGSFPGIRIFVNPGSVRIISGE